MLEFIKGEVVLIEKDRIVVENNGMGISIFVTNSCKNLKLGETIKIFCYMQIKEDCYNIFGFFSQQEKNIFLKLISVSGIGAKTAINILNNVDLNTLIISIIKGDYKSIEKCKGISKKTAEKIVVFLHDNFKKQYLEYDNATSENIVQNANEELNDALFNLGYNKRDIDLMLRNIDIKNKTTEEIIMEIFKNQ